MNTRMRTSGIHESLIQSVGTGQPCTQFSPLRLFVDPVLSGSHVSGFGWEQLLCCQFLYEAERPPRPFAFLPTLPHPFAVIALSPSFFHRPYRPELTLLSLLGGVWRLRDPSPTFRRRCSSTSPPASRPRPRTPWTISVTSGVLALS